MSPKQHLIERLRALCGLHGVETVADEIGASAENLRQIVSGTKLPSGAPRGVGPKIQRQLDRSYPGWAALSTNHDRPDVRAALPVLVRAIAQLTSTQWHMVRAALDGLPGQTDRVDEVAEAILPLLRSSSKPLAQAA